MDMGFCNNVEELTGEEISPGVVRRVLLKPDDTGKGPPGDLTVSHYTLSKGGVLDFDEKGVEFQHFIISGSNYLVSNTFTLTIQSLFLQIENIVSFMQVNLN